MAKRWIHADVAKTFGVPEDVVRRIYAAVQTAKKQGLYGGHYMDYLERAVGRKLVGSEYTVATRAKTHLGYDPPGGYGGPKPKGVAKEPVRKKPNETAQRLAAIADGAINEVLNRKRVGVGWDWDTRFDDKDRAALRLAADELDVAADLFEEAGYTVRAGTLRERAKQAREGKYLLLHTYETG